MSVPIVQCFFFSMYSPCHLLEKRLQEDGVFQSKNVRLSCLDKAENKYIHPEFMLNYILI